jgi:TOMM system kinase/cyclase fusion protein
MRCASCGFANPEGARFCIECGGPLQNRCPSCGVENLSQAKFCAACGTALSTERKPAPAQSRKGKGAKTPARAPRSKERPTSTKSKVAAPEAERRQLTVMFCDLVGSTPLAEKLDPEDLRQVILAYQQTCAEQIHRFGGYLARYVGDGLLVYFGYPQAHEDDAARAIRAGLGIVAALPDLNSRLQQTFSVLHDFPLQVRLGIHTGPVVVGEVGEGANREHLALGETPNIAARVQGVAEPDTVVISAATYRLVQGLFDCEELGAPALKGSTKRLALYRIMRESAARSRFDVSVSKGLTPLVGREEELRLLGRYWEHATAGAGQVVLLSGEAGIGKSRLVHALKEQVLAEGAIGIEFRCSPYHHNSALYPIIDHLQRLLEFTREDAPAAKLEKLQHRLSRYHFSQADTVPLLAALLSLPPPEGYPPLTVSPQKQKEKTHAALVAWLVEEAEQHPVYNLCEDIHWADPSTLEVLTLVVDQAPTARLYVLLTFRPEFTSPWGNRSHLSQMTLSRLGRPHVEAMVEQVTGGKALPTEVVQQIVAKTDGVPLFVEELTKMVVESGLLTAVHGHYELREPLPPLAIPSTLHASLLARLDRLSTVREIAQLGATIGREFSYELLHAVSSLEEETLQHGLKQLVEAELVYQRGLGPQAYYLFKHALIQDTAYQSLLKSKRQQYHSQIAQVLEQRFPETTETQPELLAHHYTEAGLITQAIPYWLQAGQGAVGRSANLEAIAHLTKGLELLKTLPGTPERAQQELRLQIALGAPLLATKGYAAPEVGNAYTQALELCQQIGETPQLLPVLWGLWQFYIVRTEFQTAYELGEQLLTAAQRVQDSAFLVGAHQALGVTLFHLGELAPARAHLEQGAALYDPQQHSSLAFLFGQDPGVAGRSFAALTLWLLGYPEQAVEKLSAALVLAQELSHPFSQAFTRFFAAWLSQFRREGQEVHEQTEALLTLSREQGFPQWLAMGPILQGWALAKRGQGAEGIAQMHQGLAAYRATETELERPYYLALLAEAYGTVEQFEEGLSVLAEALAVVDKTGERSYEAELYQLKGILTLQSKVQGLKSKVEEEAEECFQKAIEIARRQQAKSWELRAVVSLSRLWQQQGKKAKAQQVLAEIYNWFTEGFDTKDLQEAKALLEELA